MIKFTTPTLPITIKYRDGTVASDLEFDYVLLTLSCAKTKIERRVEYADVHEGHFEVKLTQEETGALLENSSIEAQLNIMVDTTRIGTNTKKLTCSKNLHNEVIIT